MKTLLIALALVSVVGVAGCTVFQDTVYQAQVETGGHADVDRAIYDELAERYGAGSVSRANLEWRYDHWMAVSAERAVGLERYRVRVSAFAQRGMDGVAEPVVIARTEAYQGRSTGRARATASNRALWVETSRDAELEAAISRGIYNRLRAGQAGGE
jgi:hypothetical protein